MGLVFTKKDKEEDGKTITFPLTPSNLSDGSTDIIEELLNTPAEKKDEEWEISFLENIIDAELAIGEQESFKAEDGYSYIMLKKPQSFDIYRKFIIREELPKILGKGMGLAVFSNNSDIPIWYFTYGDLINFYVNETFFFDKSSLWNFDFDHIKDYKLHFSEIPNTIIPEILRIVLRRALDSNGFKNTRCILLSQEKDDKQNSVVAFAKPEKDMDKFIKILEWHIPCNILFTVIDSDERFFKL